MNGEPVHAAEAERRYTSARGLLELWAGILIAPLAWSLHLSAGYFLSNVICESRWNLAFLIVSAIFLAMALTGVSYARSNYRNTGREWPRGDADGILIRSRFLAVSGMLLSGLCVLLIVAQTIPMLALEPCR
jgi:hypothetical protein